MVSVVAASTACVQFGGIQPFPCNILEPRSVFGNTFRDQISCRSWKPIGKRSRRTQYAVWQYVWRGSRSRAKRDINGHTHIWEKASCQFLSENYCHCCQVLPSTKIGNSRVSLSRYCVCNEKSDALTQQELLRWKQKILPCFEADAKDQDEDLRAICFCPDDACWRIWAGGDASVLFEMFYLNWLRICWILHYADNVVSQTAESCWGCHQGERKIVTKHGTSWQSSISSVLKRPI